MAYVVDIGAGLVNITLARILMPLCQLFFLEINRFDESLEAYLHVFCYDK